MTPEQEAAIAAARARRARKATFTPAQRAALDAVRSRRASRATKPTVVSNTPPMDPGARYPIGNDTAVRPPRADAGPRISDELTDFERATNPLGPYVAMNALEPAAAPPPVSTAFDVAMSALDGPRQGVANLAGLPVDLVNNLPRLANLLPGEQGVGTFTEGAAALTNLVAGDGTFSVPEGLDTSPVGGGAMNDWMLRGGGLIEDYQPQTRAGRIVNRIGEEMGATAVPIAGALTTAGRLGLDGVRRGNSVVKTFVEPVAVDPGRVIGREAATATAVGAGAGAANDLATEDGRGAWWSDLLGSLGGALTLGAGKSILNLGRNAVAAAVGNPAMMDEFAGRAVTQEIVNNATMAQQAFVPGASGGIDVSPLADMFSRPSDVELAFPGYRANIADRARDPALASLTYNVDGRRPGAMIERRNANDAVVDARMRGLAPDANPALFGESIDKGADRLIMEAIMGRDAADLHYGTAVQDVAPQASPVARGADLREALQLRFDDALAENSAIFEALGMQDRPANMADLRSRFDATTDALPLNDRARFLPSEVRTAVELAPDAAMKPTPSPVLDANGRPIMRPPQGATEPLSEAMALRSGLAADMRAPLAPAPQRRVTGKYLDDVGDFIRNSLDPEQQALFDEANAGRLDIGRRFEDRGAIPSILRTSGRDQYVMPDENVAPRATGRETDYRAVMAEVGTDPLARAALADQVRAEAAKANALRSPEALARFMTDRGFLLADFPEVRAALEKAGVAKTALDAAEAAARKAQDTYTAGANTPVGRYRKFDNATNVRQAIATVWQSARPEESARELLRVAGDTPETRASARAALWTEISDTGRLRAPTTTGGDGVSRWNGAALAERFDDPRFAKVAEVLWEDDPKHLADIRGVVGALAGAESSARARPPNASGTAAALTNGYDPSMSATGLASRARSVSRGQLSPSIALVDVASTWLRNRAGRVGQRAIDDLLAQVVNDPELAARLLRRFNPADEAAVRRSFLDAYGMRIPTVANIFGTADDGEDEDAELRRAVMGEP